MYYGYGDNIAGKESCESLKCIEAAIAYSRPSYVNTSTIPSTQMTSITDNDKVNKKSAEDVYKLRHDSGYKDNFIDIEAVVNTDLSLDEFNSKLIEFIESLDSTIFGSFKQVDEDGNIL
jgi:hypothetical protein